MESKQVFVKQTMEQSEPSYEITMKRNLLRRMAGLFKTRWKYSCYWEEENAETYDDGIVESVLPYIVEQQWVKAREIKMRDFCIDETDFPWHGYSLSDFIELNTKLQKCRNEIESIRCSKDVEKFRKRNVKVYDSYFQIPICVMKDEEGGIRFFEDGRHRIYVASINNDSIPVWILEYKNIDEVDRDYFIKHLFSGSWRFLNEF